MTPLHFADRAKQLLTSEILDKSGSVLYSEAATLKPCPFYFLGVNPGGSEEGTNTVRASLDDLTNKSRNAYLDENWSGANVRYAVGEHPLQRNARELFRHLGVHLRDVCASNLLFNRSKGQSTADWDTAEVCWEVHKLILSVVAPRVIIAFGVFPFRFIAAQLGLKAGDDYPSGHGNWVCRSASAQGQPLLIGLPHLSRYALHAHLSVLDWIGELVNSHQLAP